MQDGFRTSYSGYQNARMSERKGGGGGGGEREIEMRGGGRRKWNWSKRERERKERSLSGVQWFAKLALCFLFAHARLIVDMKRSKTNDTRMLSNLYSLFINSLTGQEKTLKKPTPFLPQVC